MHNPYAGQSNTYNDEIYVFLKEINLEQFASNVKEAGGECLDDLRDLNESELKELAIAVGMKLIHQGRFIKQCKKLRQNQVFATIKNPYKIAPPPANVQSPQVQNQVDQQRMNRSEFSGFMSGAAQGMNKMINGMSQFAQQQQQMNYDANQRQRTMYPVVMREVPSNQKCPKCRGNGWVHDSTMSHGTGDQNQKCFFCVDCKGCGSKGYFQSMQKVMTTTNAFGQVSTQSIDSMSTCPKCRGNGWVHTSSMQHKTKDPNKKCFFCEDCTSCNGNGRIQ